MTNDQRLEEVKQIIDDNMMRPMSPARLSELNSAIIGHLSRICLNQEEEIQSLKRLVQRIKPECMAW